MEKLSKQRRRISQRTRDILFALSGNECAHPDCTEKIVQGGAEGYSAAKIVNIAHIYSHSPNGPRGQGGLTEDQLVAPENLLLLCPNHHVLVDKLDSEYTAETLQQWKKQHEAKQTQKRSHTQQPFLQEPRQPTALADERITQEIAKLRKARFYPDFDSLGFIRRFGNELIKGQLAGGSHSIRGRALAWCARVVYREAPSEAEQYLLNAKSLSDCIEVSIADALVTAPMGNTSQALRQLADIDTPMSKTAALTLCIRENQPQQVIDWFEKTGIVSTDLDSEGRCLLIRLLHTISDWDKAFLEVATLAEDDYRETSFLQLCAAMANLLKAVPEELRDVVAKQPPFHASRFPLADDPEAIQCRRRAQLLFAKAKSAAQELNCNSTARIAEDYELWLLLRDPERAEVARERLEHLLEDPNSSLRFVNLAVEFGLPIDKKRVHSEIEQHKTIRGGHSTDSAIASLSLALDELSSTDLVAYIDENLQALKEFIDINAMANFLIEGLCNIGRLDEAYRRLEGTDLDGLSESVKARLHEQLTTMQESNPLGSLKSRFERSGKLPDLVQLVMELNKNKVSSSDLLYYKDLFQRTKASEHLSWYAKALNDTGNQEKLLDVLNSQPVSLGESPQLQILYCWTLLQRGKLTKARQYMQNIQQNFDDPNYCSLYFNLYVSLGDWNQLPQLVLNNLDCWESRTGDQLLNAAKLAFHLSPPQAFDLVSRAVEQSSEDPNILINAYLLATQAGLDDRSDVHQWLCKAIDLSGENGPVHSATLDDLVEMQPAWNRDTAEIWKRLQKGEIPICVACGMLNRSVSELTLVPALLNLQEPDPRKRTAIPAYWGGRLKAQPNLSEPIALDSTALMTLTLLGIVEEVLDAFNNIWIPNSTLRWLFEEKQRIAFHQPSRIRDAERLRSFCAKDRVSILDKVTPNDKLLSEVGEEMAELLAAAHQRADDEEHGCFVVHPLPVYRTTSLMHEEADLGDYAGRLCACQSVVAALVLRGHISAEKRDRAQAYFDIHEIPVSEAIPIPDNATLYIDGLAINYFIHLDLLSDIHRAGFKIIISRQKISEANQLIDHGALSVEAGEMLGKLQRVLALRIAEGDIKVGRAALETWNSPMAMQEDPSISVLLLAETCTTIISDDRCINSRLEVHQGNHTASISNTLDLLNTLAVNGIFTEDQRLNYRSQLRRQGYVFVPVEGRELRALFRSSPVQDSRIVETTELRAVRENIATAMIGTWLKLPDEHPYLATLWHTCTDALQKIWLNCTNLDEARVRSNWLLARLEIRRWAGHLVEVEENTWQAGWIVQVSGLLMRPIGVTDAALDAYQKWVEDAVLRPLGWPGAIRNEVITQWKSFMKDNVRNVSSKLDDHVDRDQEVVATLAASLLNHAALPIVKSDLLKDLDFLKSFGISTTSNISFVGIAARFTRSVLLSAVRKVLAGMSERKIKDHAGNRWRVRRITSDDSEQQLILCRGQIRLSLAAFGMLSPNKDLRLAELSRMTLRTYQAKDIFDSWHQIIEQRPLDDEEFDVLYADLKNTPISVANALRDDLEKRKTGILPFPYSEKYFERLIGVYDGSSTISEYAAGRGGDFLRQLVQTDPYQGFLTGLLSAAHPALSARLEVQGLSTKDIGKAFSLAKGCGDPISITGAIEVGSRLVGRNPEIEQCIISLIERIRNDDVLNEETSGYRLLSALFIFSYSEVSRLRLMETKPPFYRRLAAFAHASLVQRELYNTPIDRAIRCQRLSEEGYFLFLIQSFCDLRVDPRLAPQLVSPAQLKAEFVGRIYSAFSDNFNEIKGSEIHSLLEADGPNGLKAHIRLNSFWPAPLDSRRNSEMGLPDELKQKLEQIRESSKIDMESIIFLANAVQWFRVDRDCSKSIASELIRVGHRLEDIEDNENLSVMLKGLAIIAACTRSTKLAKEIRVLVRRYRRQALASLDIAATMEICLYASASYSDTDGWVRFLGNWIEELAFGDLTGNERKILRSYIEGLTHVVPQLWASCSRADAALAVYASAN